MTFHPRTSVHVTRRVAHGAALAGLLLGAGSLAACGTAARASNAPQPNVTVSEWKIDAPSTIAAGQAKLVIKNGGTVQHELLVFRSNLAPSQYPLDKDGNIDEENATVTKVSDGDNINKGATQSREVDLSQPGTYMFVCNLPGHFHQGMYKVVTVQ